MKIGIDASRLRAAMTGVGRYTEGVLGALERELPEATFVLYARRECSFPLPSARWSIRCDRHPAFSHLPTTLWIHYRLGSLVKLDDLDVFWATNTLLPSGIETHVYSVTTVYDLIHLLVPETLTPLMRFAYKRWFEADVRSAKCVVAISQGTARRLQDHLGRVTDALVFPAIPFHASAGSVDAILAKLNVQKPFVMTVGADIPRKNLNSAVEAVRRLKSLNILSDYQLVMVGVKLHGSARTFVQSPDDAHWIRRIGYIDDSALAALYASAEAFIFPSIYEGYGMPVAEARSLGCRVITTDSMESREAGGEDAIYVESTPDGVAAGLQLALSRPAPLPVPPKHGWADAARALAEMFRQVAATDRTAQKKSR